MLNNFEGHLRHCSDSSSRVVIKYLLFDLWQTLRATVLFELRWRLRQCLQPTNRSCLFERKWAH